MFYRGALKYTPGVYTSVDASGLESLSQIESGRIAVVGTAEGGIPAGDVVEVDDFIKLRSPRAVRNTFRSGDLLDACLFAFQPSADPRIPNGATEIIAMKVNPATQSTLTLTGSDALSAVILESRDYGAYTTQISAKVETGASGGNYRKLTVSLEGVTEVKDDIGGVNLSTIQYNPGTNGWNTSMTAAVSSAGQVTAAATRLIANLNAQVVVPLAANRTLRVTSADAGDNGRILTVYGLTAGGVPQSENFTVVGAGSTAGGAQTFLLGSVFGCVLRTAAGALVTAVGQIDVEDNNGGFPNILELPIGASARGCVVGDTMYVAPGTTPSILAGGASVATVAVFGRTAGGAVVSEAITMNGGTPVNFALSTYAQLEVIVTAAVNQTTTVSATAAQSNTTTHNTLQRLADFFNTKRIAASTGFIWTNITGRTGTAHTDLDIISATTCLSAALGLRGDIAAFVNYINASSKFITAEKVSGARGPVANTGSPAMPVFLTGGVEGTALSTHYEDAFEKLHKLHVDTIALLSDDPAVHALLRAHLIERVGVDEADGVVGLSALSGVTPTGELPTKTEIKDQIVALNSQHIRAIGQGFERFNAAAPSVRTTFEPRMGTAIIAGMQAGAPPALALTRKFMNVLSIEQDATWNPTADSDEMIEAGLWIMERVEGTGVRSVRDITTYLIDNNLAFSEASVNRLANIATRDLRAGLDAIVGMPGFQGTVNDIIAVTKARLNRQLTTIPYPLITAWRGLEAEVVLDVADLSVEIAPVIPINFIRPVIHLTAGSLRAAA